MAEEFRETLPPGRGGRLLKPGEKPKTAYDPFAGAPPGAPRAPQRPRRYADDFSGFRLMPEITCPACGAGLQRRFSTPKTEIKGPARKGQATRGGSLVPLHELRCDNHKTGCKFAGKIKGRVVPTLADGKGAPPGYQPTKAEMAHAFQWHVNRMHAEKLEEINLIDPFPDREQA